MSVRVCVIGGGAAGLMAAGRAAELGASVLLLERNEKCGKKIYITGKGRCNVTNDCQRTEFFQNIMRGAKFLQSSYSAFGSAQTMSFFEGNGCPLITERGNRVFPQSGKASDITKALISYCQRYGAQIAYNSHVTGIETDGGSVIAVRTDTGRIECDALIIATGGMSYPATGSTGDGYGFARAAGHTVAALRPSLVPFITAPDAVAGLAGLTLKNTGVKLMHGGKKIAEQFGELLFTHRGVSGPTVLTLSAAADVSSGGYSLSLDLKPALSEGALDARVLKDFALNKSKQLSNSLFELLPRALVPKIIEQSDISPEKFVHSITASERRALVSTLKGFTLPILSAGGYTEAVVTAGGVDLKEIDPKTMRSKLIKGLYFCGEVLDIDALTGGFNLQIAFTTGRCAGQWAASAD